MRILTWNIRQGGKYPAEIAASIQNHDPDLIVLTEYRTKGVQIAQILRDAGLIYQFDSSPEPNTNGIFIAAKEEVQLLTFCYHSASDRQRWVEVFLPREDFAVLGVHIPPEFNRDKTLRKRVFWEAVYDYAKDHEDKLSLIVGDFNTGLKIDGEGAPFQEHKFMTKLSELGWADALRALHPEERDFTRWSNSRGNGEFSKEDIEEILTFALEMRRRVKEQLKKVGGMEFGAFSLIFYSTPQEAVFKALGVE